MKIRVMTLTTLIVFMNGCSIMNEKFSCNQTAGDSCLTIDEVNAITEPKGTYHKRSAFHNSALLERKNNKPSSLWIAKHTGTKGEIFPESTIALNEK